MDTPKEIRNRTELGAAMIRRDCDVEALFSFSTTEDLALAMGGIIGQERAVRAMEFGLTMDEADYHIYIAGPSGTGKTTYATVRIRDQAKGFPSPADWCYVFNASQPDAPKLLELPSGLGKKLQSDVQSFVDEVRQDLPTLLESTDHQRQKRQLVQQAELSIQDVWKPLSHSAAEAGFSLERTPQGVMTVPLDSTGQPMTPQQFAGLSESEQQYWQERGETVNEQVQDGLRELRQIERALKTQLAAFDQNAADQFINGLLETWTRGYEPYPIVRALLEQMKQDMCAHLQYFSTEGTDAPTLPAPSEFTGDFFQRYRVHVFLDNGGVNGRPVIVETHPTYTNLFGKIDYQNRGNMIYTDFTQLKPGSVHKANGGYLILQARDLLMIPYAYDMLKQTLRSGLAAIQPLMEAGATVQLPTFKPEPMPVRLKVILIGPEEIYYELFHRDEEFRQLFKIKVDFDTEMAYTPENVHQFASLVADICHTRAMRPFDRSAVGRLVEASSRLAGHQEQLSTRFNEIISLMAEANRWAGLDQAPVVTGEYVQRAIEEKIIRLNHLEERLREWTRQGILLLDANGLAVGQINGLGVLNLGDYAFGKPQRITARVSIGSAGVVNIEREIQLSGQSHSKGILTLSGFLSGRFGREIPMNMNASIAFEQQYEGVDGDSASSAELFALLSALSDLPIDQGIAVTGSINQMGQIQPIGGVNEKIEGFYRLCLMRGLTGQQGVIIPVQNVRHLMLDRDISQAVATGMFHIWAINTADEGIALLTGVQAGETDEAGRYPPSSVNGRITRRLEEFARHLKNIMG